MLPDDDRSKVNQCINNVYDIWEQHKSEKSAQLVFCDSSTPKSGFNIYDEMRRLLMDMGIPGEEIAFVHDAGTEKKRSELFGNVQDGEVRVLLGSTFKLGLGVNVQDRLIAVHHLDVPWRPADMIQREGRILRQGNTNEKIYIYRYITEGSFDAYSWQLLETKQRFITALLSGSYIERSGTDIEDTVLDYEPHLALFVSDNDPLLFYRAIAEFGKKALVTGGKLFFEINPLEASALKDMLEEAGYHNIELRKDIFGKQRMIKALL